jgi:hypothetical protein
VAFLQISPKHRIQVANPHSCEPYDLRHLIIMVCCILVHKCTNFALSPLGFNSRVLFEVFDTSRVWISHKSIQGDILWLFQLSFEVLFCLSLICSITPNIGLSSLL